MFFVAMTMPLKSGILPLLVKFLFFQVGNMFVAEEKEVAAVRCVGEKFLYLSYIYNYFLFNN